MGSSASIALSNNINIKPFAFILESPQCEWIGEGSKAIVLSGSSYSVEQYNGRGNGICISTDSEPVLFSMDGTPNDMALRVYEDEGLALEIDHRKYESGNSLSLWCNNGHKEWSCKFCLNEDWTISPIDGSSILKNLVLGVKKNHNSVILVPHHDTQRKIVLKETNALKKHISQTQMQRKEALKPFPLLFKSPHCEWFGERANAIILNGGPYHLKQHNGRGNGICVGSSAEALLVSMDGPCDNMVIRIFGDEELALEVNHRKYEVGSSLSLWSCIGHKEWACRFSFNEDRTISPVNNGSVMSTLAVGVEEGGQGLILVSRDDLERRIVVETKEVLDGFKAEAERLQEEAKEKVSYMKQKAQDACSADVLEQLKRNGFAQFGGFVETELVNEALKEINRQIGQSTSGVDKFKAKSFPKHPSITNLFNKSALPFLLEILLGKNRSGSLPKQSTGQLALRFPGDACPGNQCKITPQAYEGVRKGWHIDGCPNDFIPGVTDHYGQVHNFDALVGVLLSRVEEPMSGELCCYPGSHYALSEYYQDRGLDELCLKGNAVLPTGDKTDEVFQSPPVNCVGNPGDVFIANYMTAHFIAPNTSPHIRYAVYFRVKGPSFPPSPFNPTSMLHPWVNWKIMEGIDVSNDEAFDKDAGISLHENLQEVAKAEELSTHHLMVDNLKAVQSSWDITSQVFKAISGLKALHKEPLYSTILSPKA
mmetsp:Transcript_28452/g.37187  ORF Transcript_28452/g.37187 Transcript_28452/m.37187 type:complete len:709 (-) Transcript_28452:570-2696(-)